jgi:hypothetical protein
VLIFSQVLFYYSSLQAPAKFRPTGVTIIAILNIIEGVTMVVGGISPRCCRHISLFGSTICFPEWRLPWLWYVPFRDCAFFPWGRSRCNRRCDNCDWDCIVHCCLWTLKGYGIGLDSNCSYINYWHRIECNFNCYRKYRWYSQHYYKRNNPLLPLQTACQGVFWQGSCKNRC